MFHKNRTWVIRRVDSAEALATMLTKRMWTLCSGFVIDGHEELLFLNDATHEDGAGEYGLIRGGLAATQRFQIDSITFSWCSTSEALEYIRDVIHGAKDSPHVEVRVSVETPDEHKRCPFCA